MVPLHEPGEAAALADARNIHLVVRLELVDEHAISGLEVAITGL
jgi:hypothetical protein